MITGPSIIILVFVGQQRGHRPRPVERLLRQEARYGCCKCGHPIFQYHHIVPYTEEDPHYRPDDMMALCPNCHDEATKGVLQEAEQRKLKANPSNLRHGHAQGQLAVKHREARIKFGDSLMMVTQGSILEVDGESLLGIDLGPEGDLRLSIGLYDRDDNHLARIIDNVWESDDPFPWDLDFGYRHLTIRSAPRKIALELDLRGDEPQLRAELWCRGHALKVGDEGIEFGQGGGVRNGTLEGFALVLDTTTMSLLFAAPRREPIRTREDRISRNDPCWCGSGRKSKKCHGGGYPA